MNFSLLINMERFSPDKSYRELFEELVELVQLAEAGGFETVWFGEHHTIEFTISPNPLLLIANLAARTSHIRLGTAILTAPYWHPVRLAGEAAMTDIMTNGRLELGMARGAYQYEFDRMAQISQAEGAKYLNELVPVMQGLWAGDYSHDGECYSFPTATSVPKPLQQPHPPLWIAARGRPTHEFAVASGCNVMGTPLSKPDEEVHELAERFAGVCAEQPDVPRPRLMIARQTVVLGDPGDWRHAVDAFIDHGRHFENLFRNTGKVYNGFPEAVDLAEVESRDDYDPATIHRNQMIGAPDEIIPRIQQYADWGVDQYCYHADNGMSHADKKASLERFIRDVMPAFQTSAQRQTQQG